MYEQDKAMQYAFYCGVVVFFVFAMCYFGTSNIDTTRSERARDGIVNSESINTELQKGTERIQSQTADSQREIGDAISRIGSTEAKLKRAEDAVAKCESILEGARRRAQEENQKTK